MSSLPYQKALPFASSHSRSEINSQRVFWGSFRRVTLPEMVFMFHECHHVWLGHMGWLLGDCACPGSWTHSSFSFPTNSMDETGHDESFTSFWDLMSCQELKRAPHRQVSPAYLPLGPCSPPAPKNTSSLPSVPAKACSSTPAWWDCKHWVIARDSKCWRKQRGEKMTSRVVAAKWRHETSLLAARQG